MSVIFLSLRSYVWHGRAEVRLVMFIQRFVKGGEEELGF